MKTTILFLLLIALMCGVLLAETIDVNGRFRSPTPGGFPDAWVMHEWSGYKPLPTVKTIPNACEGNTALSITDVLGDDGGAIQTRARFSARSGSVGRVSLMAKGKGLAWATFYRWGEKGQWNGVIVSSPFALSETWQPHVLTIPIDNGHACETRAVTLAIGGKMGAEIQICNLTLDIRPATIVGDNRLPKSWTVFGPVAEDFKPSPEQLQSIPDALGGAKGEAANLISNTLDVAPLVGPGPNRCAWAMARIEAKYDCDMTVGAAAAGAMQYYLNGEPVFEIAAPGNAPSAVEIDNHVKTVRLKPGTNVIAIRIVTGEAGSVVKVAGPLDLRGVVRRLQLARPAFEEDFDGISVQCSGNPQLIQGHPTPGLLAVTGQGVFRTDAKLAITCPNNVEPLPDKSDENLFAAAGVRVQNLGREPSARQTATFEIAASDMVCRIVSGKDEVLTVSVLENNSQLDTLEIPSNCLPADFVFGLNGCGKWTVSIHSLVDSKTTTLSGKRRSPGPSTVEFSYCLLAGNTPAEATLDNLVIGLARQESKTSSTPFRLDLAPQFDPVQAGWKKVFDEQFDGQGVDAGKWHFSPTSERDYAKVHDGLLEIVCNWATPDKTKTKSASLYSNEVFGHGYFEARVKFRQQPGWWSAFWLCTHGPSNPFLDGWEIDIYEDYYMGPKNLGEPPRGALDHNLHVFACGTLRSWNYGSQLPGNVDDWYVVGCKWTPFEVSYYLNGKLIESEANHSPYNSVTFDPFNHAAGYVPLHAILSGCCGKSGGDPTKGKFPESFFVDYVRIYEYPHDSDPVVRLTKKPDEATFILKPGEELDFEADVEPSSKSGAKIKQVYLFDSGALLDYRSAPPYRFHVKITQDYYDGTNFVKPGRAGIRPDWDRGLHAFCVFAQDENGNVGRSENVVRLLRKHGKTGPYRGKPAQLPGAIMLSHYDEGGQGFAYSDGTPGNNASKTFRTNEDVDAGETVIGGVSGGEWLKYTVHVNRTANYTCTLDYGTPSPQQRGPKLMVDCQAVGDFETPAHEFPDWRHTSRAVLRGVPLTEGDHEIVLLMQGSYNLGALHVGAE
ncbi:MAG: family 16 glycosylhydrolase [Thermoguttaceae bacterium]